MSAQPPQEPLDPTSPRPRHFERFRLAHPGVAEAYDRLGESVRSAGPLKPREVALVKLALAVGAWREGAVHSHTRRALEAECSPADIRHVVLLGTTTLGFPSMMAAMTWVEDVLDRE